MPQNRKQGDGTVCLRWWTLLFLVKPLSAGKANVGVLLDRLNIESKARKVEVSTLEIFVSRSLPVPQPSTLKESARYLATPGGLERTAEF